MRCGWILPLATALLLGFGAASPVTACTGKRLIGEWNEDESSRAVIFTGTAVRRDDEFGGPVQSTVDPYYWTFIVDSLERGQVGERITVASPRGGGSCGIEFQLGQRYRVVAWGGDPKRPDVMQGDATSLPPLRNPPPIEGEFERDVPATIIFGVLVTAAGVCGLLFERIRRRKAQS